jgi:hypothetical protein
MVLDTTTRTLVARHVPFTKVSFSDSLCGDGGTFSAEFPIGHPAFTEWVSSDQLRRVIVPCRDGVPQGFYLLTEVPTNDAASVMQPVRGQRLDWLFGKRAITQTLTFNSVDQNRIMRDLMRFGMGRSTVYASPSQILESDVLAAAQIPWIVLDDTVSGVTRVRQETTGNADDGYPGTSRKIVAQMVQNLTNLRDESGTRGPEYRWLYRMNNGWPEMVLDTAGPSFRVGKPEDSGVVSFEYPGGRRGTVRSAQYGSDGTTIVTRGHVVGQKQDTAIPVGMATYGGLMDLGFPLIDKVSSESSVQDQGVLDAKAAGLLWAADDAWSLTLDGGGNPSWGSYAIGDWVVLRVRQGATPKRRSMRITGWTIAPSDTGVSEKITPTLQVGKWYS